ncbi:hypothetical protein CCYA_CCYA16G4132 [Cyanidiococcus yangmingshanensis]|nr:hypothetical protein CCYA_CCYA16G4132 [Cyanidiococcus yangmingshanensis]
MRSLSRVRTALLRACGEECSKTGTLRGGFLLRSLDEYAASGQRNFRSSCHTMYDRKVSAFPALPTYWGRFLTSASSKPAVERLLQTNRSGVGMPRFWKKFTILETAAAKKLCPTSAVYNVSFDGNMLYSTPSRPLFVPTLPLTLALLHEWERHPERLRPASMPLTRLLAKSVELDHSQQSICRQEILEYFQMDSVCFLDSSHESLLEKQKLLWSPLREFVSELLGTKIEITEEVVVRGIQTKAAIKSMQRYVAKLDPWSLVAFHSIACLSRSAIIGLNVQRCNISIEHALHAARCVEDWQADHNGVVEGEHDVDRAFLGSSIGAASIVCRMAHIYPAAFATASDLVHVT